MTKTKIPQDRNIIELPLEEAMPDNYLPYAVEVAKDRALPDVRDGLKPVHRRILYGAYLLKAFPDRQYMKSARIVGDIMGKFHPHGDSSVYDAMTILAQDPDPGRVATIRWFGIAIMVIGLAVIFLRWWRER